MLSSSIEWRIQPAAVCAWKLGSLNGTIDVKCIGVDAVASIYWLPVEERGLNYDELSQVSDKSEIKI